MSYTRLPGSGETIYTPPATGTVEINGEVFLFRKGDPVIVESWKVETINKVLSGIASKDSPAIEASNDVEAASEGGDDQGARTTEGAAPRRKK